MLRRQTPKSGDPVNPRHRLVRRASLVGASIGVVALGLGVGPALAEEELKVSPSEVIFGEPGSVVTVATEPIPAELIGRTCDLRVTTTNGSSVHPGNTLISSTGSAVVEIPGVEADPDGSVADITAVELGDTLVIQLRLGPEGVSSLGFSVSVDCPDPAPGPDPSSNQQTPPPTTAPPTTEPPTTEAPTSAPTPTVLPARQENPTATPANPVVATPTFTG